MLLADPNNLNSTFYDPPGISRHLRIHGQACASLSQIQHTTWLAVGIRTEPKCYHCMKLAALQQPATPITSSRLAGAGLVEVAKSHGLLTTLFIVSSTRSA